MTPERWHRVNELFHSALERQPAQRREFLNQACADDNELRREVESLIGSHENPDSFIDAPPLKAAAQLLAEQKPGLAAGQRIGHYKILSMLGRGGMGEVYLAHDGKLGRKVALKLLPATLTRDLDRAHRFEQEARAASALNHPNILTIFDIEEVDDLHFIATEYIEGKTLRELVTESRLSLSEALDVAVQVAGALAAAHKAGIVHRDIKPENIMLRPDGYVKVVDFGLAKLAERRIVQTDTGSTIATAIKTDTGAVMGTAHYMSPEQARGIAVDAQTDIFSLGIVIYEMVAGRVPFEGETTSHVIVAILESDPAPLTQYWPSAPTELQRIISKALKKDREERYRTANELLVDLKSLGQQSSEEKAETQRAPEDRGGHGTERIRGRKTLTLNRTIWLAAAVTLLIGGALWYRFSRHTAKPPAALMKIVPFTSLPGWEFQPAFSPDGKKIAFVWGGEKDDNTDIYVEQIDAGAPHRLTTNVATDLFPVWSPDGSYIAFSRFSDTEIGIYIVAANGGTERKVYSPNWDFPHLPWGDVCPHIDWSPDGKYLALPDKSSPQDLLAIFLLELETRETHKLTSPPEPHYNGDWAPSFSPDGKMLAFLRGSSYAVEDMYVVPVAGGEASRLTFDNVSLRRFAWTADGREIVFTSTRGGAEHGLWRVPISGGMPEPLATGVGVRDLAISRQGDRLAYAQSSGAHTDIWRMEISPSTGRGSSPTKFASSTRDDSVPQYSPDGKKIAFESDRSGTAQIWMCDSDGSNQVQLTNFRGLAAGAPSWSPDGRQIAFDARPEGHSHIFRIDIEGGQPRQVTSDAYDNVAPHWSKDGQWIYFSSNRGGEPQIWKVPADGGEALQVTKRAGVPSFESPDGKFLFYYQNVTPRIASIWRSPLEGGPEKLVTQIPNSGDWLSWAVTERGFYFSNPQAKPRPDIEFFSFATGKVKQIATTGQPGMGGFAVSPDGRWMLYTQSPDSTGSDIMLVEGFR